MGSRTRRGALAIVIAFLVVPAVTFGAPAASPPAPGDQFDPAVAFDGTNYFVVWSDDRMPPDVHGARVTQQGAVLDEDSIPITARPGYQLYPDVAFDGTNYLVIWDDLVGNDRHVYGARVSPSGVVLDPNAIPISTAPGSGESSVAFDGTNYLVVWKDVRVNNSRVHGARVSPNGTVLDPNGFVISTRPFPQHEPALAFGGTQYLVTWQEFSASALDLYGARVLPSGTVLDPDGIPISTAPNGQRTPAVAYDGVNYLVTWDDARGIVYNPDIFGARVTAAGTVLDPDGLMIAARTTIQQEPAIAFDQVNYLVAWHDGTSPTYDVLATRVTPSGVILDPAASRSRSSPACRARPRSPSAERTTSSPGRTVATRAITTSRGHG